MARIREVTPRTTRIRNRRDRRCRVPVAAKTNTLEAMLHARLRWSEYPPEGFRGGAVTVGNFDGVHRGHAALVAMARSLGRPCVAVTFDPPPLHVLVPAAAKVPLTRLQDRIALLHAVGADGVLTLKADAALLALSPEAFFEDVMLDMLRAKAVVEGSDFRFGRGRAGDVNTLRALCGRHGLAFAAVPPVQVGEAVSSSRVRAALLAGDVVHAADLLGRPYSLGGIVVEGAKRGRTLGFPTANLGDVETLVPAVGVYAARATVGRECYAAAANVGPNPTFGEEARKIEIHLLDFAGDLYGERLTVAFVKRLRDTRPFPGVAELVAQLHADVAAVRNILGDGR